MISNATVLDELAEELNASRPRPIPLPRIERIRTNLEGEGEPDIYLSSRPNGSFAPSSGFYVIDADTETALSIQLSERAAARQMWPLYADEIRPREPTGHPIEWLVVPLEYIPALAGRLEAHGFRHLEEVKA